MDDGRIRCLTSLLREHTRLRCWIRPLSILAASGANFEDILTPLLRASGFERRVAPFTLGIVSLEWNSAVSLTAPRPNEREAVNVDLVAARK